MVGRLAFTAGTRKVIHAFDKSTGQIVWSHDLVKEYGATPLLVRAPIKSGYAVSPLAYNDTIIVPAGGLGQAVMAFRQIDGRLVWKAGDFLIAEASPILIDVDGQTQLVVFGGETVNGLNPSTGAMLWSHPHNTDMDMNNRTPSEHLADGDVPTWAPQFVASQHRVAEVDANGRQGGRDAESEPNPDLEIGE